VRTITLAKKSSGSVPLNAFPDFFAGKESVTAVIQTVLDVEENDVFSSRGFSFAVKSAKILFVPNDVRSAHLPVASEAKSLPLTRKAIFFLCPCDVSIHFCRFSSSFAYGNHVPFFSVFFLADMSFSCDQILLPPREKSGERPSFVRSSFFRP
jgi:hypothetical protein